MKTNGSENKKPNNNVNENVNENVNDNDNDNITTAIAFWDKNFPMSINSTIVQKLEDYNEMESSLIIYAMERAILNGKTSFSYVDGILRSFKNKGFTKRIQAEEAEQEFQERKTPKVETDEEALERKNKILEAMYDNIGV